MTAHSVWHRVAAHAGETFYTVTGIPFSYHMNGDRISLHNTNWSIPRRDVEDAVTVVRPFLSSSKEGIKDHLICLGLSPIPELSDSSSFLSAIKRPRF